MKFMLIMRNTDAAVKAAEQVPFEEILNAMGAYNEELMNAGVLFTAEGLTPAAEGAVVDFAADPPTTSDGAYGDAIEERFDGFWILRTDTREEALEWAKRCPLGPGSKLEVRQVGELEDFPEYSDNEYVRKEKQWREELGQQ